MIAESICEAIALGMTEIRFGFNANRRVFRRTLGILLYYIQFVQMGFESRTWPDSETTAIIFVDRVVSHEESTRGRFGAYAARVLVLKYTTDQGTVNLESAFAVLNKTKFAELVHKQIDAAAGRTDQSGQSFLREAGNF